jgi:hypothetical protein
VDGCKLGVVVWRRLYQDGGVAVRGEVLRGGAQGRQPWNQLTTLAPGNDQTSRASSRADLRDTCAHASLRRPFFVADKVTRF